MSNLLRKSDPLGALPPDAGKLEGFTPQTQDKLGALPPDPQDI